MQQYEKKEYGSQESVTTTKRLHKPHNYHGLRYDTDILGKNIIITGISFLRERKDSHSRLRSDWLLTLFLEENDMRLQIVSNHTCVRGIIEHFTAKPDTPLRCRIITQGKDQAKRYILTEPIENKGDTDTE